MNQVVAIVLLVVLPIVAVVIGVPMLFSARRGDATSRNASTLLNVGLALLFMVVCIGGGIWAFTAAVGNSANKGLEELPGADFNVGVEQGR